MTISSTTNRTSAIGSGAIGQEIAFTFPINATSDLTVIKRITATGVETTLTETTDYTVVITVGTGGTVTTVTAIETTEQIHIIRNTPRTQATDLERGGDFNSETLEDAFDKLQKQITENYNAIQRCVRAPETDASDVDMELPSSVDRVSTIFIFDSDGNVDVE